jgi:Polysaccharide lyase
MERLNMTAKFCNQPHKPQTKRALRPVLGTLLLSTTLFVSVGVHQSHAGIIESVTENISGANMGKGGDACQKLETTTTVKRAGQRAFKHWVNRCGERAEMSLKKTEIGKTYWYGWSMLIPSDWKDTTEGFDIVNQWATYPQKKGRDFGKIACSANGSFIARGNNGGRVRGADPDRFEFMLQSAGDSKDIECQKFPLAKVAEMRGKWTDFVMNVKWTGNKDGFLKFWVKIGDGPYVQKINYTGRTFWNDEGKGPYFKMGEYKGEPGFKGPAPRYLYTDEYRLGDGNSSFGQVAP